MEFLRDRAIFIIAERPCLRSSPLDQSTLRRRGSNRSSLAAAISLPATPLTKTPPLPHGKGVAKHVARATAMSVPTTPTTKQQANPHVTAFRHSDGASQGFKSFSSVQVSAAAQGGCHSSDLSSVQQSAANRSTPTTPVKKQCAGFPLLPPPPPSSRAGSSHHAHRVASSAPSTPVKKSASDFLHQTSQSGSASHLGHAHHDSSPHRGSANSDGSAGLRLSGGNDGGGGGGARRLSGHSEQQGSHGNPFRQDGSSHSRRSSQGDSTGSPAGNGNHVTGKPPMGTHGRAIAAPPYGKLVERVQKGEYRQTQARSMLLSSDPSYSQMTPTFGHVTGDSSTGRRPLSLV